MLQLNECLVHEIVETIYFAAHTLVDEEGKPVSPQLNLQAAPFIYSLVMQAIAHAKGGSPVIAKVEPIPASRIKAFGPELPAILASVENHHAA